MTTSTTTRTHEVGEPRWIEPALHRTAGRDPLGLQTITRDRIIPTLVPGILALSQRARYLSFHSFLLDEYARRKLAPSNQALSKFILAREYEHALAVEMCPRHCGSAPVGRDRSGPEAKAERDAYARGESVETDLGGYGLYYRTPLAELGIVARAGTLLGGESIPVDVLVPGGRGSVLAAAFRASIADTTYYKEHFVGRGKIPCEVLEEYGACACLCRLDEVEDERDLLREAVMEPATDDFESVAEQRRRSFALYLTTVREQPEAASEVGAFRDQIWNAFSSRGAVGPAQRRVTAQWAALILKEYMQESLSAMWIDLCREGLRTQPSAGFDPVGLRDLLRSQLARSRVLEVARKEITARPEMATMTFRDELLSAAKVLSLEALREWAREQDTALAGLALLLVIGDRLPTVESLDDDDRAFLDIGIQRSYRQEGLIQVVRAMQRHLEETPTLADTVQWLIKRYIIEVHERVAYSKLPNFTFRFRWEAGLLRFYNLGIWPFDLADSRHQAIGWFCEDLGYIAPESDDRDRYRVTADGESLIQRVFA